MPKSQRLVPSVFADAGRIYVRSLALIVVVAVAVFGITDAALHVVNDWLNHAVEIADVAGVAVDGALLLVVLASSIFGEVLFAGLLDRVVEPGLEGRPPPSLGEVASGLPYLRLLAADALVVGIAILGLVLCILPGIAAFTLLALAGPLVIVEDLGPWRAVRRSFDLLRGRLGAALVLVLVPTLVTSSIEDQIASMNWSTAATVAVAVALNATLAAYAGLLIAVLARRLANASPPPA